MDSCCSLAPVTVATEPQIQFNSQRIWLNEAETVSGWWRMVLQDDDVLGIFRWQMLKEMDWCGGVVWWRSLTSSAGPVVDGTNAGRSYRTGSIRERDGPEPQKGGSKEIKELRSLYQNHRLWQEREELEREMYWLVQSRFETVLTTSYIYCILCIIIMSATSLYKAKYILSQVVAYQQRGV